VSRERLPGLVPAEPYWQVGQFLHGERPSTGTSRLTPPSPSTATSPAVGGFARSWPRWTWCGPTRMTACTTRRSAATGWPTGARSPRAVRHQLASPRRAHLLRPGRVRQWPDPQPGRRDERRMRSCDAVRIVVRPGRLRTIVICLQNRRTAHSVVGGFDSRPPPGTRVGRLW